MPPFWGVSAAMAPPAAIARASPAPSEIANLEITLFILCSLLSVIFQIFLFLVEAVTLGHHCSALRPAHADPDQSSCRYNIVTRTADRDRKSVVEGKSESVRVDIGGRRINNKKNK